MMAIKNVALIGANGNLGTEVLSALVSAGHFQVTVVKRASSLYSIPAALSTHDIRIKIVDDELSLESLKAALEGQDAVIVSMPLKEPAQHLRVADAAAAVGIKRVIPADYGSCDSDSPRVQELVPLFRAKVDVRARLQQHAAAHPDFSWTSIVGGHFFDWGLREKFLHFDLRKRATDIVDYGRYRSSMSTLGRVSEAVVAVLARDDDRTKNRVLFIQSFCVSQLDVLAALERATGAQWEIRHLDSDEYIRERKAKADAGDKQAVEDLVFVLGTLDGNWEERDGFAMKLLGLKNENLDEVIRRVVESQA
jgi:nucleoside-diphosphate-sugar epimerase